MKKRPIIICLLVALLGSVLFWLQSNYIITGWLKGEAFYQGRPTSYWRRELGDVEFVNSCGNVRSLEELNRGKIFYRKTRSLPERLNPINENRNPVPIQDFDFLEDHPLWTGDPQARDVLNELMEGSTSTIRDFAKKGVARIKE